MSNNNGEEINSNLNILVAFCCTFVIFVTKLNRNFGMSLNLNFGPYWNMKKNRNLNLGFGSKLNFGRNRNLILNFPITTLEVPTNRRICFIRVSDSERSELYEDIVIWRSLCKGQKNHFYGLNTVFVLCCIVTIVSKLVCGSFLWPSVTQKESFKMKPNRLAKLILWKHYQSHFVRGFESHFILNCRKNGVKAIPGSIPAPICVLTGKYTKKNSRQMRKTKKDSVF